MHRTYRPGPQNAYLGQSADDLLQSVPTMGSLQTLQIGTESGSLDCEHRFDQMRSPFLRTIHCKDHSVLSSSVAMLPLFLFLRYPRNSNPVPPGASPRASLRKT